MSFLNPGLAPTFATMNTKLLSKYDIPAPRYTSYPTVPYWNKIAPTETEWIKTVQNTFAQNQEISVYIHLPYCENLCTYCGCNKYITKNHSVEKPYIDTLLKEWQLYLKYLGKTPTIKELHLGGGTPTFFQAKELQRLLEGILSNAKVAEDYEFSFEAHPSNTTEMHLQTLYDLGFRRISIGVQDFAGRILQLINRKQSTEEVVDLTLQARAIGYESINYDIIFGLPTQTKDDIHHTMEQISTLKPERIAFYSYAHVPWIKPSQRAYSEADLPIGEEKRQLYDYGRSLLEALGYEEIGLDHFALPTDELSIALKTGQLHRNFMGYTAQHTQLMIGLGASSISDSWTAYVQNEKNVKRYQEIIQEGHLPIIRGHLLSPEDQILRWHILQLMCKFKTTWQESTLQTEGLYAGLERMQEFENDGLIKMHPFELEVLPKGRPFIRNICLALDARYWKKQPEGNLFSQVV